MAAPIMQFAVSSEQVKGYEFTVRFDESSAPLLMDGPPGLGHAAGPCPTQMLAAAVGNCLAMTLVLFARRAGVELDQVRATVQASLVRNEEGLPRIGGIAVELDPGFAEQDLARAPAILAAFERYCAVTESVRSGVEVRLVLAGAGAAVRHPL